MSLPTTTPAEVLQISPEALEIANAYLQDSDIDKVCDSLDLSRDLVTSILDKKEVKAYINSVFFNVGFNNRFTMRRAMDAVIRKKFQELEESETGSTKDIAELLELSHKMTMQELSKQIELEKLQQTNVRNQVNVQIDDQGRSKYENLMKQLIGGIVE